MNRVRYVTTFIAMALPFLCCGCPRQVVPPPASIGPRPVLEPPGRLTPKPLTPLPPKKQAGNPWKPQAKAREWTSIVIHHTATSRGSVESIHASHLRRKDAAGNPWLGIGYHFVIGNGNGMGDGEIEPTFRWRKQLHGAHAGDRQHNQHGIGIALVGNFEKQPPSKAQLLAIKRLVSTLKREYAIPAKNVVGHNSFRATACPGRYFPLTEVAQSESGTLLGRNVRPPVHATETTVVKREIQHP